LSGGEGEERGQHTLNPKSQTINPCQAEKEKSDAKMKSKVEEERLRMEKEMAMLKGQLAAAKTEAEKAASPKIPKTRVRKLQIKDWDKG